MDKYVKIKMIGKGNFGDVWLVEDNKGQKFALKIIDLQFQNVDPTNEVTLLKILKHPNIIRYYNSFVQNDQLFIIMEFAENYDIQHYTKSNPSNILSWFTQLCQAIQYLHSQKIIHKDIKMKNVFLTNDGIIKLGDFSISKKLDTSLNFGSTTTGTPYYISPEICESKPYNTKTDIWSLGCLLYELCTKEKPFQGESLPQIFNEIIYGQTPQLSKDFPQFYQDIINLCLQKNAEDRPTIEYILDIPEIKAEKLKFSQFYKQKLVSILKQVDNTQFEINFQKSNHKPIFTPQNKSSSLLFKHLFSEQIQTNIKKPMIKKIISINTEQIENEQQQNKNNQQSQCQNKQLYYPKTPTSPNRNTLLADFLKNKLGDLIFMKVRDILENSNEPLQLLENKDFMSTIIGEQNLDYLKIFKILICNCTSPPGGHLLNNYQFLRGKLYDSQNDLDDNNKIKKF